MALPPATAEDAPAQETADGYFSPLAPAKYVLLAMFKWGRTPVATPARVVVHGDRAYFQTWSTSRTCKRLRHNDWVQVAPCAALGLYRYGPWLDATARLLAGEEAGQAGITFEADAAGRRAHGHQREHPASDLEDGHLIAERVVLRRPRLGAACRHHPIAP